MGIDAASSEERNERAPLILNAAHDFRITRSRDAMGGMRFARR